MEAIRSKQITQRAAEIKYGIPRSTIKNKLGGKHYDKVGRKRIFNDEEESSFEEHLVKLCEFGFPMIEIDFWFAVKSYLDTKGVNITQFKNNLPGYEWTKSFLSRHQNLSVRMSQNIKKVRAEVGASDIISYIENLGEVIKNVPATHIWNYDETNLTDDPGNTRK